MKKLVVIFALGLSIVGTTYAQNTPYRNNNSNNASGQEREGKRHKEGFRSDNNQQPKMSLEQRASQRTEMLSEKLGLNKSQKKRLQALNLNHAQQMQSLDGQFPQGRDHNKQQHEQRQLAQANWENEFKRIVSKKQYTKYEAERKQMQVNRSKQFGNDDNSSRLRRPANG